MPKLFPGSMVDVMGYAAENWYNEHSYSSQSACMSRETTMNADLRAEMSHLREEFKHINKERMNRSGSMKK